MPIDLEKVRKDLFSDHEIAISKDDPVLAFLATHDAILKQYGEHIAKAIAEGLGNYENTAIASNEKLLTDAKNTANHILNQSLQEVINHIDAEKSGLEATKERNQIEVVEANRSTGLLLILTAVNSILIVALFVLAIL